MPAPSRPVALVTGAAGRTGRAVVARLEAEGFAVAGIDLVDGPGSLSLKADVADREALTSAVEEAVRVLGPIAVLVTAADVHETAAFGELDDASWRRSLEVLLGGTGNACAAVLPAMIAAAGGTIVTVSSRAAVDPRPGESYRAAATGTILAFSRSLAAEVAPHGVRLNCIAGGSPEEVAETVAFLARDGDFYVGQVFEPAGRGATR